MLRLPDSMTIMFRPIEPGDQATLQRFHDRLSSQSIHQRFFGAMPQLGERQAHRFSHVDGIDRCALVALDPENTNELIGVARYDREGDTQTAEYACIIADRWQGHGLGTVLTRELILLALANGIDTMVAIVLPENRQMLEMLAFLGYEQTITWEDDVARVALDLRSRPL